MLLQVTEFPSFLIFIYLFIYFKFYLFILGCVGSLLLCTASCSCGEQGPLLVAVCGLLIVVASPVVEHGL